MEFKDFLEDIDTDIYMSGSPEYRSKYSDNMRKLFLKLKAYEQNIQELQKLCVPCPECKGTGKDDIVPCDRCKSLGYISSGGE